MFMRTNMTWQRRFRQCKKQNGSTVKQVLKKPSENQTLHPEAGGHNGGRPSGGTDG